MNLIREVLYKETGILCEGSRKPSLRNKIMAHIQSLGIDINEYVELLKEDVNEKQRLIELVTVNETYFFRNFPQLQGFAEQVLPFYLKKKQKKFLRIWSAACSTGEEPYTLSIILREMMDDFENWKIELFGTDIDTHALEIARKGEYGFRSIKNVPTMYLEKYFIPKGRYWQISPEIQHSVVFSNLNLIDQAAMATMQEFDFIFCRNVLIYFSLPAAKKTLAAFKQSLRPGGFLFLGSSESVPRIDNSFQLMKFNDFWGYHKPEE